MMQLGWKPAVNRHDLSIAAHSGPRVKVDRAFHRAMLRCDVKVDRVAPLRSIARW